MTEFTSSDYSPQLTVCVCVVCVGLRLTNPIQRLKQVPLRTGFLQTNRVRLGSVRVCLSFRFPLCIMAQPDGNAQMRSLCAMTHAMTNLSQLAANGCVSSMTNIAVERSSCDLDHLYLT